MEIIKPGVEYQLSNYLDKGKYTYIKFIEKSTYDVKNSDGTTNEEIFKMMLDRFQELEGKKSDSINRQIIINLSSILNLCRIRQSRKKNNKEKYLKKENDNTNNTISSSEK